MDIEKSTIINKAFHSTKGRAWQRYLECEKQALSMVYNEAYKKGFQDGRNSIRKDKE